MRPNSIRARMTVGFALFTAALMLLMCAAFYFYVKHSDRKNADALLRQAAQEVRLDMADDARQFDQMPDLLRETSSDLRSRDMAMLVIGQTGHILAHSPTPIPTWPLRGDSWRATTVEGRGYSIVLAVPWGKTEHVLRERTLLLLALSLLVVAASAAGTWILVGRTLSPIDGLARQAQAASVEHLRVQLQAPTPDAEIARLVLTLNDLLARWSETVQSRERFYAAAAHELRTPLQALSGHLEVALSRQRSALEYQSALRESHAQTERLTGLVQDLLFLNQLDADTSRPPAVLLDVADICESKLLALRQLAQQRKVRIDVELPERCELSAPWNHATMLIGNLLENAVKYAECSDAVGSDAVGSNAVGSNAVGSNAVGSNAVGSNAVGSDDNADCGETVCVRLHDKTLSICNSCVLDAGTEAQRFFEPFYRADASRNSATGGNGLGLAICQSICDANGWSISLQQHHDTLCATVVFASQSV